VPTGPSAAWDRYIHPDDERMAAFRRVYDRYLVVEDIYPDVARRLFAGGCRRFVDLGGGRGELCGLLANAGVDTVLADLDEQMLGEGTRPALLADLARLPLANASIDAAAAINCLYFLPDPLIGIREAHRVLTPGGTFVASSPSRWNDPELRDIDPRWGRASTFDSEDAPALVAAAFGDVEIEAWELVAYRLPDADAIRDYLHAFDVPDWQARADAITPPLEITKIGAHIWAHK
jgi:SAM-dependent methyltransferase